MTIIRIRDASRDEPTLDELLSDPIVKDVMRADAIDTGELRAALSAVARELQARRARQVSASAAVLSNRAIPEGCCAAVD
jgi:hypothetical protein